jgi:hypothetical protein
MAAGSEPAAAGKHYRIRIALLLHPASVLPWKTRWDNVAIAIVEQI